MSDEDSEKEDIDIDNLEYEILREDYSYFDLSFKIIVIGNCGK